MTEIGYNALYKAFSFLTVIFIWMGVFCVVEWMDEVDLVLWDVMLDVL
jgi:hypothetical protein